MPRLPHNLRTTLRAEVEVHRTYRLGESCEGNSLLAHVTVTTCDEDNVSITITDKAQDMPKAGAGGSTIALDLSPFASYGLKAALQKVGF